jgi:uracil-DNA glycosylase
MTDTDEARLRKWQAGEIARALRKQLAWQGVLGADGAPSSTPLQRRQLRQRIREAQSPTPSPPSVTQGETPQAKPGAAPPPPPRKSGIQAAAAAASTAEPARATSAPAMRTEIAAMMAQSNPRKIAHEALRNVRDELGNCQRCKLHSGRLNIVFGVGNPAAELVFIGEAPGFHEDKQGEPFVGKAGGLLDKMITAMGLSRSDVYILNIIKCRPPGNRDPEADEMAACEPFLIRQLEALEPKIIVTLGRYATQALLRESTGITKLRGKWHTYQGVRLMPTFHPAYLLRNPAAKRPTWDDLQLVMTEIRGAADPG